MRNIIIATVISLLSCIGSVSGQNAPLLKGKDLYDRFAATSLVEVDVQGFNYKYSGDWLRFMKLENENTISFSRGSVTHSFDLRRVVLLQEERSFIKVFIR
jgi:hypothetical protein